MRTDDVLREARRLLPGWQLAAYERRSQGQRVIVVEARHDASSGVDWVFRDLDDISDVRSSIASNPEVARVRAAPSLEHPSLVLGLRGLVDAFQWSSVELRSVVFLLFGEGALSHDEAAWLAGFVAHDAPMRMVSPTSDRAI